MSITERKQKLMEQLRTVREQKGQYEEALTQTKNAEQQLMGAITVLEQLEQEAKAPVSQPPALPDDGGKKRWRGKRRR